MVDMTKEIWKDVNVEGFEGLYKVSNYGNVYSIRSHKVLAPRTCGQSSHVKVHLCNHGMNREALIHRLVAAAFLELDFDDKTQVVNHLDQNPRNNRVDNLEITTSRDNSLYSQRRHPQREKTAIIVRYFDKDMNLLSSFDCMRTAAQAKHMTTANLSRIYKKYGDIFVDRDGSYIVFGDNVPTEKPHRQGAIKVTNLETGDVEVYEIIADAVRATGLDRKTICRWLKRNNEHYNKSKTSKYKFEYWGQNK